MDCYNYDMDNTTCRGTARQRSKHDATLEERLVFRSKKAETGCWEWTGALNNCGYGYLGVRGKQIFAHRAAWMAFVGAIPFSKMVLHKCDNRKCINPEHLFIGTAYDNHIDMLSKRGRRRRGCQVGIVASDS